MNWVTINEDLCNDCGLCVLRCRCYSKENGKIVVQANQDTCSLCGHCVSLCRTNAIIHNQMDMDNFKEISTKANFETDAFIDFIRARRSHRHFKKKEIPKQDIEKLVDVCRYAPTGGNLQNVELMIVRDQDIIARLSNITIDLFEKWGNRAREKIERLEADAKEVDLMLQRTARYGERLQQFRNDGMDPIFYKAPIVLIFHAAKGNKGNCMIASTTVSLTARTMGIESTYIGLFERAAHDNESVYKVLNLPAENEIYSILIMGYPKLKYLRTVDRKPVKATWL